MRALLSSTFSCLGLPNQKTDETRVFIIVFFFYPNVVNSKLRPISVAILQYSQSISVAFKEQFNTVYFYLSLIYFLDEFALTNLNRRDILFLFTIQLFDERYDKGISEHTYNINNLRKNDRLAVYGYSMDIT